MASEKRTIAYSLDATDVDEVASVASQLLSERTRQLGFVVAPRIDRVVLRHVSLVRLTTDQLLAVLISQTGETHRRVIPDDGADDQAKLDRIAAMLNDRVAGLTLRDARAGLIGRKRRLVRPFARVEEGFVDTHGQLCERVAVSTRSGVTSIPLVAPM